jgi:hypothetical protein
VASRNSNESLYISENNIRPSARILNSRASNPDTVAIVTLYKLSSHEVVPGRRESHVYVLHSNFDVMIRMMKWNSHIGDEFRAV